MHAIQPFIVQSPRSRTYRYGDMALISGAADDIYQDATPKLPPAAVCHPQLETMTGVAVTNRI
ncbi:hypothetical protein BQ8794_230100 [Mesorhizobium prunaredense]|uniref:Uncharacterized protein n=1 Tax=Mesorhizobium prunaredense TaxID=1631249 RepID=A0A1R3V939_9HYPH|nr:hypothetical protein BQ8794_230100 [Mesorhizobium prunaredense]